MLSNKTNPIDKEINDSILHNSTSAGLLISAISAKYDINSERLLGFLLNLNYQEMSIVTCDPWKRKCGGVPRNSFVIVKVNKKSVDPEDAIFAERIILARVTDSVPTPIQGDIQGTIFQIHKVQALVDPITQKELQWSALKASVVGTYYDKKNEFSENIEVGFGNDVDNFFAPHTYEVYVPVGDDLEKLINSFVNVNNPLTIGQLRYTETPTLLPQVNVSIKVDPRDFIGRDNGHRTALFGKTRFGKSNTIKVIADTILNSEFPAGQVIFDPSGEYTYINEQDGTSLYDLHKEKCVRYSLDPKEIDLEKKLGIERPKTLKINFYSNVLISHGLISQLWDAYHSNRPNYMLPILEWSPIDPMDAPKAEKKSEFNHYWRTMSLWFAVLYKAGFPITENATVPIDFPKLVKEHLVKKLKEAIKQNDKGFIPNQSIKVLPAIFAEIALLLKDKENSENYFPRSSTTGEEYFNEVEKSLIKILDTKNNISGVQYFQPFLKYHSLEGSNVMQEISDYAIKESKTIFIDFAKTDEEVSKNLSERISKKILSDMMNLFSSNSLDGKFVVLYFEEAHNLFRQDDKDLNSIYNKLAKEGAKFNISMVYATQSMTTMSPDLLKNTENFFIAHLDDDREVREVTRKYVFKDVAEDVQRCMSKGYVRMITQSHRYALPVQIRLFKKNKE